MPTCSSKSRQSASKWETCLQETVCSGRKCETLHAAWFCNSIISYHKQYAKSTHCSSILELRHNGRKGSGRKILVVTKVMKPKCIKNGFGGTLKSF